MTMVEEHYRTRHASRHKGGEWKISKPIEDWYYQSIRDLSGLGVDENLMSREWRKVVQRGNREDAKKERREAERVHLERERGKEKERERRKRRYRERKDYDSDDQSSCSDLHILHSPHKEKCKSKPAPESPKGTGTPKWAICTRRHCPRTHEMIKCNGRCGLTSCVDKAHRCHKIAIDYECSDPTCEECKKKKEKLEEWEKKVANPKFEEKWVDCPCEDPWCRRKVLEVKEIEKPKTKLFVTK